MSGSLRRKKLGKDSEKTRKSSGFWAIVDRGEKWDTWIQSILSRALPSRLDGVNGASPPLSHGHAKTKHDFKAFFQVL